MVRKEPDGERPIFGPATSLLVGRSPVAGMLPPHAWASQARHESVSPKETNASRSVVLPAQSSGRAIRAYWREGFFVSARSQAAAGMLPRQNRAPRPKILAPHRHIISLNAPVTSRSFVWRKAGSADGKRHGFASPGTRLASSRKRDREARASLQPCCTACNGLYRVFRAHICFPWSLRTATMRTGACGRPPRAGARAGSNSLAPHPVENRNNISNQFASGKPRHSFCGPNTRALVALSHKPHSIWRTYTLQLKNPL
jgi:hypothetical protein